MKKVKYCGYYNEICKRDWCKHNEGCGAGGIITTKKCTKKEAANLIEKKKAERHLQNLRSSLNFLNKHQDELKKLGAKLTIEVEPFRCEKYEEENEEKCLVKCGYCK